MSEAMRRKRISMMLAIVIGALIVAGVVWWAFIRNPARDHDVARRREIYSHFAPMPGAVRIAEHIEEFRADGRPTGRYELRVVYRIAEGASAADVLAHYRAQIPAGWVEASDATCAAVLANSPPPPTAASSPGVTVSPTNPAQFTLMFRRSNLTVFAPNEATVPVGKTEGLSILLSAETGEKTVTLESVTYGCGADSSDRAADIFDAG